MALCRSCQRPIIWVVVAKTGGRMPLDATPTPDGQVVLDGPQGTARALKKGEAYDGLRYTSHHATCPDGPAWRGQKREQLRLDGLEAGLEAPRGDGKYPGAMASHDELLRRANAGDERALEQIEPGRRKRSGAAAAAGYSATTLRVWTCPGCKQLRSGPRCKACREARPAPGR